MKGKHLETMINKYGNVFVKVTDPHLREQDIDVNMVILVTSVEWEDYGEDELVQVVNYKLLPEHYDYNKKYGSHNFYNKQRNPTLNIYQALGSIEQGVKSTLHVMENDDWGVILNEAKVKELTNPTPEYTFEKFIEEVYPQFYSVLKNQYEQREGQ